LAAVGVEPAAGQFKIDATEDDSVRDARLGANDSQQHQWRVDALALDIDLAVGLTLGVAVKFNTAVDIDLVNDDSTVCFTAWTLKRGSDLAVDIDLKTRQLLDVRAGLEWCTTLLAMDVCFTASASVKALPKLLPEHKAHTEYVEK